MNNFHRILIKMSTFVVATSLLLSVVACGSPSQTTEGQLKVESTAVSPVTEISTSAKSGPVTLADTAVQTPSTTGEMKYGGTFNRLWADPPTLDPHLTSDTTSAGILSLIHI